MSKEKFKIPVNVHLDNTPRSMICCWLSTSWTCSVVSGWCFVSCCAVRYDLLGTCWVLWYLIDVSSVAVLLGMIGCGLLTRYIRKWVLWYLADALLIVGLSGMIGYGLAKAAIHQLVQSLGAENSGMPSDSVAVAILPWVLFEMGFPAISHLYPQKVVLFC